MDLWIGALNLGLLYAFMATGTLITFRILKFSDITVDGSFTTGAALTAVMIINGHNPLIALGAGFLGAAAAGLITGFIYTKMQINGLLAGILVMIGVYSVNLRIMGKSNIPLLSSPTIITFLEDRNPGLPKELWLCITLIIILGLFWLGLSLFFKTDLGITIRASGDNPTMALASGVNVNLINILALALANGLTGVSGGLVAQYQGFSDISMGIGTLMIGLASVIIGESILKKSSVYIIILSTVIGSVIYRLMIALALYAGMDPIDLKLFTSIFVLITLFITHKGSEKKQRLPGISYILRYKHILIPACIIILIIGKVAVKNILFNEATRYHNIGVIQLTNNGLLDITRDSFCEEMKQIGYIDGKNCKIDLQNAQGDMPTVNTILDKFIMNKYDVIVTISTGTTQAALGKTKTIPIVFGTVANPFIIGAGESDTKHLPNVTGVYGFTPMNETVAYTKMLCPGKIKTGTMWDPGQVNAVFNVEELQKAIKKCPEITFEGVTINGSSEVYQAASSLAEKDIDIFVLPPDNIVFSAFDSIVKVGNSKKIPVFINDIERIQDGALIAYGYDFRLSGIQCAHLVDRILKGENPSTIPFEVFKKIDLALNLKVAKELNKKIPEELLSKATIIVDENGKVTKKDEVTYGSRNQKKLALFWFNDNKLMMAVRDGVKAELKEKGLLDNITIYEKSAQGDYSNAQAIGQEIVQNKYDYIITLSTPALQVMAGMNKTIPHIFGGVTDPYRMGVAKNSKEHQKNITGVATFQPLETSFMLMRELFPGAQKVGIVWNPSEACSEACTEKARESAKKYNFQLLEATVTGTGEVLDALNTLTGQNIDLFITSGDNTVLLSMETIAKILREKKIPYITNDFSDIDKGSFFSVGADYYEVGRETGRQAEKVIGGENTENIPIDDYLPEKSALNLKLAKEYGLEIPEDKIKKFTKVLR